MKSRLASLVVLTLLSVLLVGLTQTSASASAFGARASRAQPLLGEVVRISGAVPPAKRAVSLQALRGSRWVSIGSGRTRAGGAYAFNVRASAKTVAYRVFAPKKKKGKKAPARFSNVVGVRGVAPALYLGAPVVSAGTTTMPTAATFVPARPNTYVNLYRIVNGKAVYAGRAKQNAAGVARFNVSGGTAGAPTTFKAIAAPGSGAPTTSSAWATSTFVSSSFYDGFTDPSYTAQHWATRAQEPGGLRKCARTDPSMFSVAGGFATLRAVRQQTNTSGNSCPNGFWYNAMVGTGNASTSYTPTYGVFSAKVKFQRNLGAHGAFWLQGPGGSNSAEIDAAEYFGAGRSDGGLASFIHAGGFKSGGIQRQAKGLIGANAAGAFHVYSVQWSPLGYTFRVDGVPTFFTTKPLVSSTPSEMILSMLTSDSELHYLTASRATSTSMQVDWVQSWQ